MIIARRHEMDQAGNWDMLPEDHYFMLIAVAVVLIVDAVAVILYLRYKP